TKQTAATSTHPRLPTPHTKLRKIVGAGHARDRRVSTAPRQKHPLAKTHVRTVPRPHVDGPGNPNFTATTSNDNRKTPTPHAHQLRYRAAPVPGQIQPCPGLRSRHAAPATHRPRPRHPTAGAHHRRSRDARLHRPRRLPLRAGQHPVPVTTPRYRPARVVPAADRTGTAGNPAPRRLGVAPDARPEPRSNPPCEGPPKPA